MSSDVNIVLARAGTVLKELAVYLRERIPGATIYPFYEPDKINIVFDWYFAFWRCGPPPPKYIVYQIEQVLSREIPGDEQMEYLMNAEDVWDISWAHKPFYDAIGRSYNVVSPGYCKRNEDIPHLDKTVDVLFYGTMNARRKKILSGLRDRGVNVRFEGSLWNDDRNQLIGESKIILNLHYYDNSVLEKIRLFHLVTNGMFVISENSVDKEDYKDMVVFADYDDLVDTCCDWLDRTPEERSCVARRCRKKFIENSKKYKIPKICQ